MNRLQLRTLVLSNLGGRTDKNDLVNSALDLGLVDLERRGRVRGFKEEVALTVAQNASIITLPARTDQVLEVRVMRDQQSYQLIILDKAVFVERWPKVTSYNVGKPTWCYQEGLSLIINPPSDAAYDLKATVLRRSEGFTSDTVENPIPGSDSVLAAYATFYVFRSMQLWTEGNNWSGQYERELREFMLSDKRSNPSRVGVEYYPFPVRNPPDPWLDPFYGRHR